jgi:ABC-type uncharacterized transport system permease subunit
MSSTSSFFTFAGPPPNMEKTLSFTVAAAEAAASVAFSVMGLSVLLSEVVLVVSGWSAALSVVTFAVSSLTRVAPGLAVWSAAGSGLATSDMFVDVE